MFCPNCGSPVPDNASFCGKCGNKLNEESTPVGGAAYNPNPTPTPTPTPAPAPAPAPQEPQTWDAYFLMRWKDFLSSGLVMTLLCCATLLQLLGAAADPMESIYDVLGSFGVPSYYYRDALGGVSTMMNSFKLIAMVPGILTVVSLWLMFVDARKGGPRLSTTGMTIIQVLQIIGLVGVCLIFGIFLLALLAAMGEMNSYRSYYGYSSGGSSGMGVALAIVIAIGVLCIFLYAKTLSAIKSVKYTLTTFTPCYDSMMFVGVLSIIGGSISALSALSMLSYGFSLSLILGAAVPILYGIVAIAYKNLMEELVPVRDRMMKGQN